MIRNGHVQEIPRKDVVVDDIIILETGEEIPADGQLLEAISLQVNESNLTGEPVINKTVIEADFDEEATYASNLVMRGTTVVDGHGTMRVLHVGDATEIGKVARQSTEENLEPTPLNIQLTKLANLIGKIGFTVAGLAFLIFFVKDVLLFLCFGFAERLARVASGFRTDPQIFHDGCYFDCSSRPRRVAHERNAQPGLEYAPYALDQQSGTKDARLRNDGSYHRDLYGQNGYTDSKPDAGTRTQLLRNQECGNLGDDDTALSSQKGSAPTQPLSSKKRQRAKNRKVSVTLRKSPCYYGSTVREEIISNSVNTPASSTSSPSRPNVNLWRLSSSLRSSERKYFI